METLNREVDGFVEKQSSIGDEETKVEDEKHALIHGRAMMENKIKELEQLSNKQTTKWVDWLNHQWPFPFFDSVIYFTPHSFTISMSTNIIISTDRLAFQ